MKKTIVAVSYLPVLVGLLAAGSTGFTSCKKKEEDNPPAPSAPPPAPPPAPVVVAPEEDAGLAALEDVVPDVRKTAGKAAPADVAGLKACCTALQQNAASLPPPNDGFALQAASMCQSLVAALASGSTTKAGALGSIGAMMKGAHLPPACK